MIWNRAPASVYPVVQGCTLGVYCRGLDDQMTEPTPKDSVILGVCALEV